MSQSPPTALLTINTGSSSLKAALFAISRTETECLTAQVERIGRAGGQMRITTAQGAVLLDHHEDFPGHVEALHAFLAWLHQHEPQAVPIAVGHRIVHGGSQYSEPQLITDALVATLQQLVPIDSEHLPQAIAAIQVVSERYPSIPQVACFDTAFHRSMPPVAQSYPLPRALWDAGVKRYGFHGLSCEYILQELRAEDGKAAEGRLIIAHLGNGASMTAVRGGVSVDTTMGFTPSGGLMMGTRSGDLDPGVLLFLLDAQAMSPAMISQLITQQSGLLGVSGISADLRDVLEKAPTDLHAAAAITLFCYQARKFLGALAAVLGGLETLIFTGGIGEHAASIRQAICAGLEFLGIQLDTQRNMRQEPIISGDGSPVVVRVMPTNEEAMIARHTHRLIAQKGAPHVSV